MFIEPDKAKFTYERSSSKFNTTSADMLIRKHNDGVILPFRPIGNIEEHINKFISDMKICAEYFNNRYKFFHN
jgi:hypothetical protein